MYGFVSDNHMMKYRTVLGSDTVLIGYLDGNIVVTSLLKAHFMYTIKSSALDDNNFNSR